MSYFSDEENDFTVYEAPKNGGTTLRLWICYAGTGEIIKSTDAAYYAGTAETYQMLQNWGYANNKFSQVTTTEKVCIKRDPVDRFISCFYDKAIKEGRIKTDIDTFLDNMDAEIKRSKEKMNDGKTNFLRFHFAPQTWHFGANKKYYDHVFDVSEVGTRLKEYLEDKWKVQLPNLHARNSGGRRKFDLTKTQVRKVHEIYKEDYNNGWV
jgi:hypothetical protein